MIDRADLARKLAKAIAFAHAGKPVEAYQWAEVLYKELMAAIEVHCAENNR